MERLLLVCLAGALGTGTRYLVALWTGSRWGTAFPFGTLTVNVAGCFLIAVVLELALDSARLSPALRLALATGFLGGLTTYSSFAYETAKLVRDGSGTASLAYFALTTLGCFVAIVLGLGVARWLSPT
jgi:CrcB protein